jgi:predicted GIY-YIG superfamily endonuclease
VYQREFESKAEAVRAERYLKRMKSRTFLEKLVSGEYALPDFQD